MFWVQLGSANSKTCKQVTYYFLYALGTNFGQDDTLIVIQSGLYSLNTSHKHQKATGFTLCIPPHSIFTCAVSTSDEIRVS